ncbi:MAG: hypothetical protein PHU21_14695 [Elusimicrobia bacterium]|nr:hypothetical protein [Elusimicrobiota bacterium]
MTQSGEQAMERDGTVLPRKTARARAWLEPPCNLAGSLMRAAFDLLPADLVLSIHDSIHRRLAAGRCYPFDEAAPALVRAAAEARALEAETGRVPALLALLSHPPVLGEMGHLNFELMRHALLALRAVRRLPCRPRQVTAVDPFALDTIGLASEGIYAGVMGLYHLGFDRLAFTRGRLSSLILAEAAWPSLAWRLCRLLRGGGEAAMALAGGTPTTARMLYTVREWMAGQRRTSPLRGRPAEVLRRLREDEGFRRFEAEGPLGPGLRRSAWRMLEGWAVSAAAGHPWAGPAPEPSAAETGRLEPRAREAFAAGSSALALTREQEAAGWAALEEEWPRQTPWRRRLFRMLAGRVLARGRPVLFVPVVHRWEPRPGIVVGEAWSWRAGACGRAGAGRISGRVLGPAPCPWQGTADEFAAEFGQANYA